MNFASLYNFYEHLVFEYISEKIVTRYHDRDEEFFLDIACYSLTRLPSRYIRHEIDMIYYLAPGERSEMEERVASIVDEAAGFINERLDRQENRS
ncbi:MAG: late competence development ComFB family protein [Gammaproteobacteria bacterium]|nr:late competence development ComFB family protein [Gammaproteobacteria bacterium]